MTRNYIILIVLCLAGIIFLNILTAPFNDIGGKDIRFLLNQEKLETLSQSVFLHLAVLLFMLLIYLLLGVVGIVNIVIFAIRKIDNKPMLDLQEERKTIPLSGKDASRLFFLVILAYFNLYVIQLYLLPLAARLNPIMLAVVSNLVLEGLIIFLVIKFLSKKWLGFKFNTRYLFALFRVYTAVLPLIFIAAIITSIILEIYGIQTTLNPAIMMLLNIKNPWLILILSLQIVIIGPLAEELLFRGFIYKLSRKRFGLLTAAFMTSAFFALLHNTPKDILPIFILSLGLCYLYEKSENILAPAIMHAVHNGISLIVLLALKELV